MIMNTRFLSALLIGFLAGVSQAMAAPERPTPPARDPHSAGFVEAKELPDGAVPPANVDGNFIIGPTHTPAEVGDGIASAASEEGQAHFAPGTAQNRASPRRRAEGGDCWLHDEERGQQDLSGDWREENTFGTPDPGDPAKLVVTTSHPAPWECTVMVYVPKQYVYGTEAPFIVGQDGPDDRLFYMLDGLIAAGRVPPIVAISIGNGGGDAQGSQRGLEYDTMSGQYAEFVETEVLPRVQTETGVRLTKDPDGRAAMGCSSGAACALAMAWYRPDLYHRVLSYSGTFVNQQWPASAETPHGAWEFHERLIPQSPVKPIRIWMEVGDKDLLNPNVMRDGMHDWVEANERMANVLAAKGYHYQFVFVRNATHCDAAMKAQTLPEALEWLWQGYPKGEAKTVPGITKAAVTFSGGHDIGPGAFGRPVTLMAAALGVSPDVFRQAFSGVRPARGRAPKGAEQRANKEALMKVLAPKGVTNERMDEVADYYRVRPERGELWPTREAQAEALIVDGKVERIVVADPGSGYSSTPTVRVKGFEKEKFIARMGYSTDLKKNGIIVGVVKDAR